MKPTPTPTCPAPDPDVVQVLLESANQHDSPLDAIYDVENQLLIAVLLDPVTRQPARWTITGPMDKAEALQRADAIRESYQRAAAALAPDGPVCH